MSEQKIDRSFTRAMDQVNKLQKAFAPGSKLEQAVSDTGGDITCFVEINKTFNELYDSLEHGHYDAIAHLSMQESKQLSEGVLDADDDDGFMARSQLYFMARDAIQLHGMIDDRDNLPGWVQSKISQSAEAIDAVRRYTEYNAMKDQVEPEMEPQLPVAVEPQPEMEESYSQGDENEQGMVSNCCGAPIMDVYQGHGRCSDCKEMASAELEESVDPDMLSDLFDNLKRGDKVKIKHDSALEKGTDYIEYIVKANNVLRNGVGKATLARADSPTSVKRYLYKRNGKVSMAIGDMAATLVDIQMSESVNEAEKRWKQTSLTPAEAEAEYGKDNVKVKKGALRNGDDMVEVFVEGMNFDEKRDGELKTVAQDMFSKAKAEAKKTVKARK